MLASLEIPCGRELARDSGVSAIMRVLTRLNREEAPSHRYSASLQFQFQFQFRFRFWFNWCPLIVRSLHKCCSANTLSTLCPRFAQ